MYPVHYCESRVGTTDTLANFHIQRTLTGQQFRVPPDFTTCLIQATLLNGVAALCVSKLCDLHMYSHASDAHSLESHRQELLSSFMYVARPFQFRYTPITSTPQSCGLACILCFLVKNPKLNGRTSVSASFLGINW